MTIDIRREVRNELKKLIDLGWKILISTIILVVGLIAWLVQWMTGAPEWVVAVFGVIVVIVVVWNCVQSHVRLDRKFLRKQHLALLKRLRRRRVLHWNKVEGEGRLGYILVAWEEDRTYTLKGRIVCMATPPCMLFSDDDDWSGVAGSSQVGLDTVMSLRKSVGIVLLKDPTLRFPGTRLSVTEFESRIML